MRHLLQINNAGAWKNVLTLRAGDARALEDAKTAVVLLSAATDDAVRWRIVRRERGQEDLRLASYDRRDGWRQRESEGL